MTALTFPPHFTRRVKSSNEILVYMNVGVGQITNTLLYPEGTGGVIADRPAPPVPLAGYCCGGDCDCPPDFFEATVIQNKNTGNVGGLLGLPIASPLFSAILGLENPVGVGDIVNHVCLPSVDNDMLVCFDQGASLQPGLVFQSIPRKFSVVDHRIRQRPENTLTLQNLFVSSWVGLQRFMGVPCTVIIMVNPDGVGAIQEVQYYCNVVLNPVPMDSGEGNDPINISMTGVYEFCAIFSNQGARQNDVSGNIV